MKLRFAIALSLLAGSALAQDPLPLWPDGAPGAKGNRPDDIPTLTPYLVDGDSRAAIVVCPGGGYEHLAMDHEGVQIAEWLNQQGISAFVLKYRLGSSGYHHPTMFEDASRAIRTVRSRAAEWRVDPHRVGVMGFSAGGHLASTVVTHFDKGNPSAKDPVDRASSRPDIGILCYPVITMGPLTHSGSRHFLLGDNPPQDLVDALSSEKQVKADTPPTFVWTTADDQIVPVQNSLLFAQALAEKHIPFALHVYEHGIHGMGLGSNAYEEGKRHPWTGDLLYWLKEQGFIK